MHEQHTAKHYYSIIQYNLTIDDDISKVKLQYQKYKYHATNSDK